MTKQHGGAIVDLGNVIIAYRLSGLNSDNYHTYPFDTIPEEPGAFEALRSFHTHFGGNITIVWKATDDAVGKNMRWLARRNFTERTGISIERIQRIGKDRCEKVDHIGQTSATHEGTTIVVDDRLEVLSHFVGKVKYLFLFRPQEKEVEQFRDTGALAHVHIVNTWQEILDILKLNT